MMRWLVVAVMLAGCSGRAQDSQPGAGSAKPKAVEDPVKAVVAKADRALADSVKLDYRRPFLAEPLDRSWVRALYLQACQGGDHRSCWMAKNLSDGGAPEHDAYRAKAEASVKQNCLAGDVMSCRAMDYYRELASDPSRYAISEACYQSGAKTCDFDELRRECHAGYPGSCRTLTILQPKAPDVQEIRAVEYKLAHEGCRLGMVSDCGLLHGDPEVPSFAPVEDRIFALEQECTIARAHCGDLGDLYRETEPAKARDAYERDCELTLSTDSEMRVNACEAAWRAYANPTSGITEPVPGRAKQLYDWACHQLKACWKCDSSGGNCVDPPPAALLYMSPSAVKAMVASADRALADSMKLDYRLPFSNVHVDREPIRAKYFDGCEAEDHRACWMAANLAVRAPSKAYVEQAKKLVRDHCIAGDVMSCRAASQAETLAGDPAHAVLSHACNSGQGCDLVGLRRECKAGYPESCFAVVSHDRKAADIAEVRAIGRKLAREGCAQGITSECDLLGNLFEVTEEERPDHLFGLEQACTLELDHCVPLAQAYPPSEAVKARDAYERACQLEQLDQEEFYCEYAWRAYTNPASGITEPVPGRAKRLRDWACEKRKTCWK